MKIATVGDLYDVMARVKECEQAVEEAQREINYGGSEATMKVKKDWHEHCKTVLRDERQETIEFISPTTN